MERVLVKHIKSCLECHFFDIGGPDLDGTPFSCPELKVKSCKIKDRTTEKKAQQQTKKWFEKCHIWNKVD